MTTKKIKRSYIYVAQSGKEEWPQIRLPLGNAINILGSNIDYDAKPEIPQPGERPVTIQTKPSLEKASSIEVSEGDWLITDVHQFVSDGEEVYFCYCQYSPIKKDWKSVPRTEEFFAPVTEAIASLPPKGIAKEKT